MRAFTDVFRSLAAAFVAPRVLLTVWLAALVPALFVVWPMWAEWDGALSQQPAASFTLDQAVDADLLRSRPGLALGLAGAVGFVLLLMAFLSGGILARVGIGPVRERYRLFWSDCGRLLLRNLRVLAVFAVAALVLGWGVDALREVGARWTDGVDPGASLVPLGFGSLRWWHLFEVGGYLAGFAFLLLVFTGKVAMARLAVHDRRSALAAWGWAAGAVLRQPLRAALSVALLVIAWMGIAQALGMATAHFLEVRENLWLGLLFGQLGALWGAVIVVATLLAARRFVPVVAGQDGVDAEVDASNAASAGTTREKIVEIPRVDPEPVREESEPAAAAETSKSTPS